MKSPKSSTENQQDFRNGQNLKPVMKQILVITAKTTWKMMKILVKAAFLIPSLVKKLAQEKQTTRTANPVENKRD